MSIKKYLVAVGLTQIHYQTESDEPSDIKDMAGKLSEYLSYLEDNPEYLD